MVNLINDEEDDELSNKAYQCLEYMGQNTVIELLKKTKVLIEKRDIKWRFKNSIMLDVFMKRERHIIVKAFGEQE